MIQFSAAMALAICLCTTSRPFPFPNPPRPDHRSSCTWDLRYTEERTLPKTVTLTLEPLALLCCLGCRSIGLLDVRGSVRIGHTAHLALLAVLKEKITLADSIPIFHRSTAFPHLRPGREPLLSSHSSTLLPQRHLPSTWQIAGPCRLVAQLRVSCRPSSCGARREQRRRGSGCSCNCPKTTPCQRKRQQFPSATLQQPGIQISMEVQAR